ncbi:MAG TPA: hypothetical protein VM778_10325 [Gemmatimonadota bacterium]|nr:hypothetical protein [Gemmatimonadota bacterium]
MRALRWMLPAIAIAFFPLACTTEGDETTVIEDEPDIIVDDRGPDVIVDERDDGIEAELNVDEDGNVTGGIRVEED